MSTFIEIYIVISSFLGTIGLLWFIFSVIYVVFHNFKTNKMMKKQLSEFKEAISKSGMGQNLNKPLTPDELELLKKTGHLEFTETINMDNLEVTKETKTNE